MSKWFRVAAQFFATLFLLLGAMFLAFGVSATQGQGAKPILGWVIYLGSVLIPWAIAFWLFRLSIKRDKE